MSIVDVNFIKDNCDNQSSTILIDSARRDKAVYPTPSQYSITFNDPLRMVHGINILDAIIPNTTYNTDSYNNLLCVATVSGAKQHPMNPQSTVGEYPYRPFLNGEEMYTNKSLGKSLEGTLQQHFDDLLNNTTFTKTLYYTDTDLAPLVYHIVITDASDMTSLFSGYTITSHTLLDSIPLKHDSVIVFTRHTRPVQVYDNHTNRYSQNSNYITFEDNGQKYAVISSSVSDIESYVRMNQVRIDATKQTLIWYTTGICTTYTIALESQINSYLALNMDTKTIWLQLANVYIPYGNYDFNSSDMAYYSVIQNMLDTYAVKGSSNNKVFTNFTVNAISLTKKYMFMADVPILFLMGKSTCGNNIGMSTGYVSPDQTYTILKYKEDMTFYLSKLQPYDSTGTGAAYASKYMVLPDGIINLSGVPYVVLKFAEIEEQVERNYPVGKQGFGIFKLMGGLNDVAHLRFDFTKFNRKPFHPIGKLSKLTITFELPTGSLYDFKGVDHTLVLSVDYYVARSPVNFSKYQLNPNYNPDYLTYSVDALERVNAQETKIRNSNLPDIQKYREQLHQYHESSSEDEGEEEDD